MGLEKSKGAHQITKCPFGCFQKQGYPQIIHFNRAFPYKPSILGVPLFLEAPIYFLHASCFSSSSSNSSSNSIDLLINIWVCRCNSFQNATKLREIPFTERMIFVWMKHLINTLCQIQFFGACMIHTHIQTRGCISWVLRCTAY